jgi:hypothetical protein
MEKRMEIKIKFSQILETIKWEIKIPSKSLYLIFYFKTYYFGVFSK